MELDGVQVMNKTSEDYFTQKRIEVMIGVATNKLHGEVQLLRKMIGQLEQELVELRNKVNIQKVQVQPFVGEQLKEESAKEPNQERLAVQQQTHEATPRYGKYTSEDVSIEKFFNFSGGKR